MRARHVLSYRPDIDGLRAVAVTLIILVHAFPSVMQNGFIGVDIFFVISGFLITGIILTNLKDGSFSLRDFYVRRINRIFPALIALLVMCIAFGWISLNANEFGLLGRSIATGAGFVANVNFYFESGYWDIAAKLKPLLHLWSLGVEEQFYLIWPLLLWGAWSWRRQSVAIALGGIMVLSLAWNLWLTGIDQPAAFYLPFGRLWELGAGGALAYAQGRGVTTERSWINDVAAFCGFALIIVALAQRYPVNQFPGARAILPVLGTVLIIGAGANSWPNTHLLSQRAIVYIGLISFPLYLWHWPALAFARILNNGDLPNAFRNAALALTVALAVATYHAIERPIGTHRHRRGMIAAIACVLLVACGVGGYAIYAKDGLSARYGYSAALPSPPQLATKAKVALIGDSFAGILHVPLQTMYGDRLVTFAAANWPYLSGVSYKPDVLLRPKVTPEETGKTLSTIMSDATIDAVIIFNNSGYTEGDSLGSYPISPPGETSAMAYEAALRRTVKLMTGAGKRVVYVRSNPFLNEIPLVEVCSSAALPVPRKRPSGCTLPVDVVRQRLQHYNGVVDRALDGVQGVSVLDPTQLVTCDERFCYVERNGVLLYRDQSHLSPIATMIVASAVAKLVESEPPGR
jgi:peptidoglycan/LPS O-acetylase OafA/YrhL